jgi:hypothetical protein
MLIGMSDADLETQPPPEMSWGFGSFLFEKAFAELALGLKLLFWGAMLWVLGGGVIALGVALTLKMPKQGLIFFMPVALIAMGVGAILLIWGEQKCLHLKLPLGMTKSLPGHKWLRLAYACHLAGILARVGRQLVPNPARKWVNLLALPVQLLGFGFLLLFLRKLADVMGRADLKGWIDAIFALSAASIASAVVIAFGRDLDHFVAKRMAVTILLGCFGLSLLSALAALISYLVLLWRMSTAVGEFSKFLAAAAPPDLDGDEAGQM